MNNKHLHRFLIGLFAVVLQLAMLCAIVMPAYLSYYYENDSYCYFYLVFVPIIPFAIYAYGSSIEKETNNNKSQNS